MKLSSLLVTGGLFVVIVAAVVVGVREAEKYANEAPSSRLAARPPARKSRSAHSR